MTPFSTVELRVYPSDCDAGGGITQEAFSGMLARARWEAFARGPGLEVSSNVGVWPVVRRITINYHVSAGAGDSLSLSSILTHLGRKSFSLHQSARRQSDQVMIAEADVLIECTGRGGEPAPVPIEIQRFFGSRPSVRAFNIQHFPVRGTSAAVDVQGDGPPVLFIHGFPLDRTMWRNMSAPLTGRQRIAPDLRGLGMSDVPHGDYSIEEYGDDMAALLDALEIETAVVCGFSMGGYVALDMVRRHRQRLRGLILVNTRAEADSADGRGSRNEMIQLVQRQGSAALVDSMVPRLVAPKTPSTMPDVVNRLRTMITGSPPSGVIGALVAMRERRDARDVLPTIDVPTLVIHGREDQLIPVESARAMAGDIPGAHFTVIAGAGHLAPMEQPVATSRVVNEFLESIY